MLFRSHAYFHLRQGMPFEWVAVRPLKPESPSWADDEMGEGNYGQVYAGDPIPRDHFVRQWHDNLLITLGGPIAQARFTGASRLTLVGPDKALIQKCLIGSRARRPKQLYADYLGLTRSLVDRHWPEITAIAEALIERRVLDFREVRALVRRARHAGVE